MIRIGLRRFHSSRVLSHSDSCSHTDKLSLALDAFIDSEEAADPTGLMSDVPELMGSCVDLEDVMRGNKAWVKKKRAEDPKFFELLGGQQKPRYLYIGCSDARVDPTQLMGFKIPGQIFVHRNVGNVVCTTDINMLTVVDFAVNHLKVPHIIVCGHYDCGAVRGSIANPESGGLGIIEHWLRNIRDVARIHRAELESIKDPEDTMRRLVELNVREQCMNVLKIPAVQKKRAAGLSSGMPVALPRVHGLIFDPKEGILKKLGLDLKKEISENQAIYNLYKVPEWARIK